MLVARSDSPRNTRYMSISIRFLLTGNIHGDFQRIMQRAASSPLVGEQVEEMKHLACAVVARGD